MRVMILTADYPPRNWSGIGVAVECQARALAAVGVEVHVIVPSETQTEAAGRSKDGPVVHTLSRRRFPVDARQFDLVHCHSLGLAELAVELRRRFGLPLVYTAHSLLPLELEDSPRARAWCAVQACLLATADAVVLLSYAERRAACSFVPGIKARSSVVGNAVPLPGPPRLAPVEGPLVFAGRFTRNKGVDLLAELLPLLLSRHPCRFVLAGGHGDATGTRAVSAVLSRCGTACRVVDWLSRDELEALLAGAALVLVPSRYEPFGLIAVEAMRLGTPVLAAKVGGLSEIAVAGSGGRAVPSRDPDRWCDAALEILTQPRIADELRRCGPGFVASRFNPKQQARRLREVYAAACRV